MRIRFDGGSEDEIRDDREQSRDSLGNESPEAGPRIKRDSVPPIANARIDR